MSLRGALLKKKKRKEKREDLFVNILIVPYRREYAEQPFSSLVHTQRQ